MKVGLLHKCPFSILLFEKCLVESGFVIFTAGSSLSRQLLVNYEALEQRYSRIVKTIIKVSCLIVATLYGLSALFPISYIIFDYPQPDQWALPMAYT